MTLFSIATVAEAQNSSPMRDRGYYCHTYLVEGLLVLSIGPSLLQQHLFVSSLSALAVTIEMLHFIISLFLGSLDAGIMRYY